MGRLTTLKVAVDLWKSICRSGQTDKLNTTIEIGSKPAQNCSIKKGRIKPPDDEVECCDQPYQMLTQIQ